MLGGKEYFSATLDTLQHMVDSDFMNSTVTNIYMPMLNELVHVNDIQWKKYTGRVQT
jgi:hypothetical protein